MPPVAVTGDLHEPIETPAQVAKIAVYVEAVGNVFLERTSPRTTRTETFLYSSLHKSCRIFMSVSPCKQGRNVMNQYDNLFADCSSTTARSSLMFRCLGPKGRPGFGRARKGPESRQALSRAPTGRQNSSQQSVGRACLPAEMLCPKLVGTCLPAGRSMPTLHALPSNLNHSGGLRLPAGRQAPG